MTSEQNPIFVIPSDEPRQIQGSLQLERLKPHGEVVLYTDGPATLEGQIDRVRDADIIINTGRILDWPALALRALPKLRMMTTSSIGTDMIDLSVASELGIVVCNQPGRTAGIVAEHVIALMLAVAKRVAFQTNEVRAGRWTGMRSITLRSKTLGVIGTGNVGREVARLAKAIGMEVIAWTYHPSMEWAAALGVRYVDLDELLRTSDVVSLHVGMSDQSREMIGRRELALMKEGSLLVNGSRGELVDILALANALNSGHLGGAALDVFDVEPVPTDHPILACEQVVFTPHMGDQTPEAIELLNEGAVNNVLAYLEGHPQNVVTK